MKKRLLPWITVIFFFILCVPRPGHAGEPSAAFPAELTGDQLYEQGFNLCKQGKNQEAIPYFKEAAKRTTESISGMITLSPLAAKAISDKFPDELRLYEKSEFEKAISRLEEIIFQEKNNYYAWYFLGLNYLKIQKWEKADVCLVIAKVYGDESLRKVTRSLLLDIPQYRTALEKQFSQEMKRDKIEQERLEELARQERERTRRKEMSNYLANLSENRRFLVTEIAKYYQGEQLENAYEIAQLSEDRSDEEVQLILNNVRALKATPGTE